MTTTREDPTKRDIPGGAANGARPPKDAASADIGGPGADKEPDKKIDPWHFGAHTVSPGLRAQLSAIELPDAPEDRRYRPLGAAAEATVDSAAPLATEELHIPKRDFRRSVAIGLALLVAVVAALAVFRCGSTETASPTVAQPATEPPRSKVAATVPPAAPTPGSDVSLQPNAVPSGSTTARAASAAPLNGSPKQAVVNPDKPRAPAAQPQPGSGLPEAPPLSTSAPAPSGDPKSFRVGPR